MGMKEQQSLTGLTIDFDNLEKMIAEKYISRQKHPDLDYYIYNYTHRAQFDRVWNNETLQCRGLILNGDNKVISRPFRKFFNLGELGQDVNLEGDFTVTEKMDGSLGISYYGDKYDGWNIATRGSFVSDQAVQATYMLRNKYRDFITNCMNPNFTYLFEIIYPANRIVVDYGQEEKLVLLAIIDTESGNEFGYDFLLRCADYIPVVQKYDGITDFKNIIQRPNSEGYVVHFPETGLRFKVKFEEYVRLHKIMTGVNAKRVWEFLKEGQDLAPMLERVPDEFYQWITKTERNLREQYLDREQAATAVWAMVKDLETRREQAAVILQQKKAIPGVVFNMLDGKMYDHIIWKDIEPEFEPPFKVDEE